jgi:hypothetical protein
MRRLGQYKTAWPARKTRVLQNPNSVEREEDKWEGHCMVRAAPQGLEVYRVPQPGTASSVSLQAYHIITTKAVVAAVV